MKIERELMRGAGPVAVLRLLQGGEMYGYELVEALARRTEGVLEMGQSTLYPLLYNLEAKGLVKAEWKSPAKGEKGGRDRKYYRLTSKGKKKLAHDTEQWRSVTSAMQSLGVLSPNTNRAVLS